MDFEKIDLETVSDAELANMLFGHGTPGGDALSDLILDDPEAAERQALDELEELLTEPFSMTRKTAAGDQCCQYIDGEGDARLQCASIADGVRVDGEPAVWCKAHYKMVYQEGTAADPTKADAIAKTLTRHDRVIHVSNGSRGTRSSDRMNHQARKLLRFIPGAK